ncbi:MAG TPA: hypothetical protein VGK73_39495 [Polyangiaceae bacterium]
MTRSNHGRSGRGASLGVLAFACLAACGSNSLVIGADPDQEAATSTGGSISGSGEGSGAGASGAAVAGAGGGTAIETPVDPYPWVPWAQGAGYLTYCPPDPGGQAFTCWNQSAEGSAACEDDGEPYCNACSCRISCDTRSDCPAASDGQPAECLGSAEGERSCFVVCAQGGACPAGMTCSVHPALGREVCVWVVADDTWQGQPR